MGADQPEDRRTVQLNMDALYGEAVERVGQEEADRLWKDNRLDSEESWPGKWAKAMELVENLRSKSADQ
ncbi:MAG: hypothetical protein BMS9Abin28_2240 [Anaerolineae bacterium]|nr:MAG: hypothetical protein BMS9Abin28_2240 [Anaerolineae bacterium]